GRALVGTNVEVRVHGSDRREVELERIDRPGARLDRLSFEHSRIQDPALAGRVRLDATRGPGGASALREDLSPAGRAADRRGARALAVATAGAQLPPRQAEQAGPNVAEIGQVGGKAGPVRRDIPG